MTKLDSIHPSLTSSADSLSRPEFVPCLLVLVSDLESDYITAIRRIWALANAQHACVQFIGLCKNAAEESSLYRQLITMSALLRDGNVSTSMKVEIGMHWVNVVRTNFQPGDTVICFAEQRAGLLQKPLSEILKSNLNIPVHILSGLYPQKSKSNWLSQIIVWSGHIGIIIGFFILQVRIGQLPIDWFQNLLLIFSIIPEFLLIWVWNNLFR